MAAFPLLHEMEKGDRGMRAFIKTTASMLPSSP
jgi:hypothetical protein